MVYAIIRKFTVIALRIWPGSATIRKMLSRPFLKNLDHQDHGWSLDGVLFLYNVCRCQVLDLSTGSQRGPGGEQASSTSGSSNMYVKYDGGTLSAVLGGHPLASVSIPSRSRSGRGGGEGSHFLSTHHTIQL